MNTKEAIGYLEKQVKNPKEGLPLELFLFLTKYTPMVNVDLLIKDEKGRTLLSWRNDEFHDAGWHVPGGIIRFKEMMKDRLQKVAKTEIGINIKFEDKPIAVNEIILKQEVRGHFISFLYRGKLPSDFVPENKGLKETDAG